MVRGLSVANEKLCYKDPNYLSCALRRFSFRHELKFHSQSAEDAGETRQPGISVFGQKLVQALPIQLGNFRQLTHSTMGFHNVSKGEQKLRLALFQRFREVTRRVLRIGEPL